MYSTCLHCNRSLGANESIEAFPIGRRLAFDSKSGRLWVVCGACERWNLSPIEERWEAIEQGERAFRATRVRASTDNIGLARLADGTELVRVGAALRPEFSAWRYGDQFGRRRTRNVIGVAGAVAGAGVVIAGGAALGTSIAAVLPLIHVANLANLARMAGKARGARLALPDGTFIRPFGLPRLVSRDDAPEGWGIEIGIAARFDQAATSFSWRQWSQWSQWREWKRENTNGEIGRVRIRGAESESVLRWALPKINRGGASRSVVQEGVQLIERAGAPEDFARWATTQLRTWNSRMRFGDNGAMDRIPAPARLALEMALHESAERRALEGELALLEAAWRDADENARIADGLLADPAIDQRVRELRVIAKGQPRTD